MIAAMLRVKNEARWIEENIRSLFPLCNRVFVFDDHSTDGTADICRNMSSNYPAPDVVVFDSPFTGMSEVNDKNWLLDKVMAAHPDWVICIDGDERLAPGAQDDVLKVVASNKADIYLFRILYLWNEPTMIRTDRIYNTFARQSMWRVNGNCGRFQSDFNHGFHCTNVPNGQGKGLLCNVRLLHFGYMSAEDRMRKFKWYNENDPANQAEDGYRHVIQGDPGGPPATERLKLAGPLRLETIHA